MSLQVQRIYSHTGELRPLAAAGRQAIKGGVQVHQSRHITASEGGSSQQTPGSCHPYPATWYLPTTHAWGKGNFVAVQPSAVLRLGVHLQRAWKSYTAWQLLLHHRGCRAYIKAHSFEERRCLELAASCRMHISCASQVWHAPNTSTASQCSSHDACPTIQHTWCLGSADLIADGQLCRS